MITLSLTPEQAECLFDEVAAADMSQVRGMSRYERRMIRTCREVRRQLAAQDVKGVIARSSH